MTKEYGLTPIDIAGRQGNFECVQVVLDFFKRTKESKFLQEIFNQKSSGNGSKIVIDKSQMIFKDKPEDENLKIKL